MQTNLFGEELATPGPALSTKRSKKAVEPEPGPPNYALFQLRLNRWVPGQAIDATPEQAAASNAWFLNMSIPLEWRPIGERKTYTIRR